ncbi:wall-associated receptor kinase-like 14 [Cajanus cajan]|uniref:Wall-associated receptor kinase-like 14 n=1 Tax=Cajanus cajan TaxID=3821 RepID=A0A151R136_CAJCA|nr:wall-associated receptor kinase-like 14 [Cajanus cajan]KYP36165.1 Wall-associated receptor kinase-like 14 [Cajanus cajan]
MITKSHVLFLVLFIPIIKAQVNSRHCLQTCGSSQPFPYPFGFSSGCGIRLNCTADGPSLGDLPVKSVTRDSILLYIKSQCNRTFDTVHLFSHKYAPTSRNVLFLANCTQSLLPCSIPEALVRTRFDSVGCNTSGNGDLNCYYDELTKGFMNYTRFNQIGCKYFMSSLSSPNYSNASDAPLPLDMNTIQLGWWLGGDQCLCSDHADCTVIQSPLDGKPGFRCHCRHGFVGDGFLAGTACRKASTCNPTKYLSGRCGGKSRVVILIGGFVIGVSLMVTMGSLCCLFRRRSKLRITKSTKRRLTEATGNNDSVAIYRYKDIERATNSFSEKQRLGTGAFGTVYAGKLYNDEWVAIKRLKHRDTDSVEQVMNEIKLLSSVSHTNLVRLLGCSIEYGEQILVYEFMPNGTLGQHLQKERGNGLPWPVRLTIAAETAQAIAHLHSAISPPIYHRDIKSSNILLDQNFRSKVADFGLSRLGMTERSHISTAPQGTPGYVDPQYHQDFHLSEKSDVYSFGVVLVEIITGLKVVDFSRPPNEVNLASLAAERIQKGVLDEIIDPLLKPEASSDAWTLYSIHKVAELAFRCLAFHRDMRPSMTEVASELEQLRLKRWTTLADSNCATSTDLSSCSSSSSSNESEKPLSTAIRKVEQKGKGCLKLQNGLGLVTLKSLQRPNSSSTDQELWLSA